MRRCFASFVPVLLTGFLAGPALMQADLKKKLAEPVTLKGLDGNTPLRDMLEFLAERYGLTIRVDKEAFRKHGLAEVDQAPIRLPEQKEVPLGKVLQRVLDQAKGTYRVKGKEVLVIPVPKTKT